MGIPTAMVTASHNPWHDNGIKLFASGGTKLTDETEALIEADVHRRLDSTADAVLGVEQSWPSVDVVEGYHTSLAAMFPAGCLSSLHIVVDAANGADSQVAPAALRSFGARVDVIHAQPDGRNINDRCGATHTDDLRAAVVERGADVGLAFDGDGDRVIAVDHLGRVVDGDRLIAMAALHLKEHGRLSGDAVVVTVMSNLGFHQAMASAGIEVVTTPVGDRYVLEALDARGLAIGGEQSGHIIYRASATTGDGLLAGLHLAQFVAEHHATLAEIAESVMTTSPQVLRNVRVDARHPDVAGEMAEEVRAAEARLGGAGRVLLRPSGTEPLIRVMVEAPTTLLADAVAAELVEAVTARYVTKSTST